LISKDVISSALRDVDVEFQAFRNSRILDVELEIEDIVAGFANGAKISPPESVGIRLVSGNMKLRGVAVQ
jgi:hypothetical protein